MTTVSDNKANPALEVILSRRTVRQYTQQPVTAAEVEQILEAGRWAPSGRNTQPWAFIVVQDPTLKTGLIGLTKYKQIVEGSTAQIVVFYDKVAGYNRTQDLLGVGACIENMLLAAHSMGIGVCWIGDVRDRVEEINRLFDLDNERYEVAALLCLGRPAPDLPPRTGRRELADLILAREPGPPPGSSG